MAIELSTVEENEVQHRLEEQFREEAETCAPQFLEYVGDSASSEIALVLSNLIRGTHESCDSAKRTAENWGNDYIQYRVANHDPHERDAIIERLTAAEIDE